MQQILAAVDFSPVSKAVVEQAALLAEAFSAELTLVHVATPDPEFVGYAVGPQTVRDEHALEFHGQHRNLQAIAENLRDRAISARALLVQGMAVEMILSERAS